MMVFNALLMMYTELCSILFNIIACEAHRRWTTNEILETNRHMWSPATFWRPSCDDWPGNFYTLLIKCYVSIVIPPGAAIVRASQHNYVYHQQTNVIGCLPKRGRSLAASLLWRHSLSFLLEHESIITLQYLSLEPWKPHQALWFFLRIMFLIFFLRIIVSFSK